MFKKPFNYTLGETRQCRLCSKEFYTIKPLWRCNACVAKEQGIIKKKIETENGSFYTGPFAGLQRKKSYPFNDNEMHKRFTRIRKSLKRCTTREEKTAHYDKCLRDIETNGILEWIYDRRDIESAKQLKVKKAMTTDEAKKRWPDTRGLQLED